MDDFFGKAAAVAIAVIIAISAYQIGSQSGYEDGFRDCAQIAEEYASYCYGELSMDCNDIIIGYEKDDYTEDEFAELMTIVDDLRASIDQLDASDIKEYCLDRLEDIK